MIWPIPARSDEENCGATKAYSSTSLFFLSHTGKSPLWIQYLFGKLIIFPHDFKVLLPFRLQEETARVEEHLLVGNFTQAIVKCFIESKANSFENLLEPLQKLLRLSPPIALSLAQPGLFSRILQKLSSNKALTRLNLLRIVQCICDASDEQGALVSMYGLYDTIQRLADSDTAILVRDMASKLTRSCDEHEIIIRSGGKRRGGRRTSSSTTPPSISSGQSIPPTPTSSRSLHSTTYLLDRDRARNLMGNVSIPYRPGREESRSTTPTLQGGSTPTASKSRLPRTTSGRSSRQSLLVTSPRKDNGTNGHNARTPTHPTPPPVMIPNSRRRRQTSGGGDNRWT